MTFVFSSKHLFQKNLPLNGLFQIFLKLNNFLLFLFRSTRNPLQKDEFKNIHICFSIVSIANQRQ